MKPAEGLATPGRESMHKKSKIRQRVDSAAHIFTKRERNPRTRKRLLVQTRSHLLNDRSHYTHERATFHAQVCTALLLSMTSVTADTREVWTALNSQRRRDETVEWCELSRRQSATSSDSVATATVWELDRSKPSLIAMYSYRPV